MKISNGEISKILYEIGEYLEIKKIPFKPRAYERAAYLIENLEEEVFDVYEKGGIKAVENIPGVGISIAEKIEELIKTGRLKFYETLKKSLPVKVRELSAIEGVGPKMIGKLYKSLKVKSVSDLEKAAKSGKLAKVKGFGKKTEEKILKSVEFMKQSKGRFLLGSILPFARAVENRLRDLKEVESVALAGSIRRMQETVGDLDFIAVSKKPEKVMDFFISMPETANVYSRGSSKTMVRLKNGIDADIRVAPKESFGAALQYFTGDKSHNIALRVLAEGKGLKLNEYGLWKGKKSIAGKTEEEIYQALGLQTPPPEIRTDSGEIQAAQKNKLPKLINYGDLRGDLQVHSNWTDGENSIEDMAEAAAHYELEYLAITDHTKSLAMTGGLDEKKLSGQMKEIERVQKKFKNLKILKGAEVNIMKDGTLDIDDETLAKLDVVGIAVHSNFNLPREEQTKRVVKAMRNPNADILIHPTGRLIQRREAFDIDIDEIIKTAKETGTILEINADPNRLDLKDEYVKKAVAAGVKLSVSTDGHHRNSFAFLEYGIGQARRGWAKKSDIVNTRSWPEMLKLLK